MLTQISIGQSIISQYFEFSEVNWERVYEASLETIYMTFVSVIAVFFLGIILGLILFETGEKNNLFSKIIHQVVAFFVYILR